MLFSCTRKEEYVTLFLPLFPDLFLLFPLLFCSMFLFCGFAGTEAPCIVLRWRQPDPEYNPKLDGKEDPKQTNASPGEFIARTTLAPAQPCC